MILDGLIYADTMTDADLAFLRSEDARNAPELSLEIVEFACTCCRHYALQGCTGLDCVRCEECRQDDAA